MPLLRRHGRPVLVLLFAALSVLRLGAQSVAGPPSGVERSGSYDGWVARVDDAGRTVWTARFGGMGADAVRALAATDDGKVLAAGQVEDPARGLDGWAAMLDASGKPLWEASYDRSGTEVLSAIAVLPSAFLLGGFRTVAAGGTVAWLLVVDASGTVLAERSLESGGFDSVVALAAAEGGALVVGVRGEPGGRSHGWLAQVDATLGIAARDRLPGRIGPTAIAVRPDGVIVTGADRGHGWLDFRDGAGAWHDMTPSLPCGTSAFDDLTVADDGGVVAVGWCVGYAGDRDALLVRLDPTLKLVWYRTYGGSEHDEAAAVAVWPERQLAVGGATRSAGAGKHDVQLMRLTVAGEPVWERLLGNAGDDRTAAVMPFAGDLIVAGYQKVWR
ncbi:MAG: hypothetical protein OXJ90_21060 [Spirochaetaceae bacterium]|nr:hypothetical protein [Spirochaetaceae bacterium]